MAWTCCCHSLLICPNLRGKGSSSLFCQHPRPRASCSSCNTPHPGCFQKPNSQSAPSFPFSPIGPPRVHQPLLLSPWRLGQKGTTCMRALSLSGCDSSSLKPEGARAFPLPRGLALVGVRPATFLTWSSRVQGSLLGDSELGPAEGCGAWSS